MSYGRIGRLRLDVLAWIWLIAAATAIAIEYSGHWSAGLTNGDGHPLGRDFVNMWAGARLAWLGRFNEVYDLAAFHAFQESIVGAGLSMYHYSYPPVMALLSLPFGALPYVPALAAWLTASTLLFTLALRCELDWRMAVPFALATPALFISVLAGQNGAWTAVCLGGGLCLLGRRPIVAGILFGLLIYKPHLGLMLPIALAAGGHWRALGAAAVTCVAAILASIGFLGAESWLHYFDQAEMLRRLVLEDGTGVWHRMVSVFVTARRFGADPALAYAIQVACAVIATGGVVWVWRSSVPSSLKYAVLVVASFLATPYLQDYDLVVATFVAVWTVRAATEAHAQPVGLGTLSALAALLALPLASAPIGKGTGYAIGGLVIVAAYTFLLAFALRLRRRHRDESGDVPALQY